MKTLLFHIYLPFLILTSFQTANAQLSGRVKNKEIQIAYPFVHITNINTQETLISDIDGSFLLTNTNFGDTLEIKHPYFTPFQVITDSTFLDINIPKNNFTTQNGFAPKKFQLDSFATNTIKNIIEKRNELSPYSNSPFYYESYNKFTLSTSSISNSKKLINKTLSFVGVNFKEVNFDHHLIISESTTKKRFHSHLKEDEVITGVKISGIEQPVLSLVNSQIQSFSFHEDFVKIASKEYTNPIGKKGNKWYRYELTDEYPLVNDTLYIIKFSALHSTWLETIKGYYYISKKDNAISHFIIQPNKERRINILLAQQNEKINNKYFPSNSRTIIDVENVSINKKKTYFLSNIENQYYNINLDTTFSKKSFSDIAIYYDDKLFQNDSTYWKNNRKIDLSRKDSNTYSYYDSTGKIKNFTQLATYGERLYFKQVPFKYITLDLDRSIVINKEEEFRLGFGLFTNKNFSPIYSLGFYSGYGFGDHKSKYRIYTKLWPKNPLHAEIEIGYFKELHEAGSTRYPNNKTQYSSEWVRDWGVERLDYVKGYEAKITARPIRYTRLLLELNSFTGAPNITYNFKNNLITHVDFSEFKAGINFSFGRRYFQLVEKQIPLKSHYPEFWIIHTTSLNNSLSDYNYQILNFRSDYSVKLHGLGQLKTRIIAGYSAGEIPYYKLHVHRGSNTSTAVSYNSFETMQFNEFASDKYISLFTTHDFGYLNWFKWKNFEPRVVIAFNAGIGRLDSKSNFDPNTIKSIEHGYAEGGVLLNNILHANLPGVKTSFGIGVYQRLGYYQEPKFIDNTHVKFSFKLRL